MYNSKKIFLFLNILVLTNLCGCSFGKTELSGLLNQPAPDTRFTMFDGTYRSIDDFKGKRIVMVFWASWCAHSRPTVKALNKIAEKYKDSDTVFLTVSVDEFENFLQLEERINALKLDNMLHVFSGNGLDDETYIRFNGKDLPHVFVIDQSGKIIAEGHNEDVVEDVL